MQGVNTQVRASLCWSEQRRLSPRESLSQGARGGGSGVGVSGSSLTHLWMKDGCASSRCELRVAPGLAVTRQWHTEKPLWAPDIATTLLLSAVKG